MVYNKVIGPGKVPVNVICGINPHYDVIKWKHFPRYWPFVRGIHRLPVNSPHKGQWCRALMVSLICAWINCRVNNREACDLKRNRTHYHVTLMICGIKPLTEVMMSYHELDLGTHFIKIVIKFTIKSLKKIQIETPYINCTHAPVMLFAISNRNLYPVSPGKPRVSGDIHARRFVRIAGDPYVCPQLKINLFNSTFELKMRYHVLIVSQLVNVEEFAKFLYCSLFKIERKFLLGSMRHKPTMTTIVIHLPLLDRVLS